MTTTCLVCGQPTDAYLCTDGADELRNTLTELAGYLDDLTTAATRRARVYRSSMKPRQIDEDWRGSEYALVRTPWAVDLDAAALLHRAGNTLTTWARHLVEARSLARPNARVQFIRFRLVVVRNRMEWRAEHLDYGPRGMSDLARWLADVTEAIRYDEAAAVAYRELGALHDEIRRAIDRRPSRIYAGPCHARIGKTTCDRHLYAKVSPWLLDNDGQRTDVKITCDGWRPDGRLPGDDGCGAEHSAEDRVDWLLAVFDGALVTIDELLAVLPRLFPMYPRPPKTVVQAWVRQGRLLPHSITSDAVERFKGSQMLALVEAYKPHAYAPRRRRSA